MAIREFAVKHRRSAVGCNELFLRVARHGVASIFAVACVFSVAWTTSARGEAAQNADANSETNDLAATQRVRVAGIVLKWLRAEKEANYSRAEKLITEAAQGGAKACLYHRVLSRRLCD